MILAILLSVFVYAGTPNRQYEVELIDYVEDFLKSVNKTKGYYRRYNEAVEMVPYILTYCERYNVDPLRVAVLADLEGSWKPDVVGALGELGPLQVMPRHFKKRFGLDDLDSQIHAGVWWLSVALERCNHDGARAFNYYASNQCGKVPSGKSRYRERRYNRAVRKYRKRRIR